MPFIPFRGRFRRRYTEISHAESEATTLDIPTLGSSTPLVDIADKHFSDARFGTIRVKCWPRAEIEDPGRRWGKYGSMDVVIMPFRTVAYLSANSARLTTYEVELFFCNFEIATSRTLSFSQPCCLGQYGRPCGGHSNLNLVELPAPKEMEGGLRDSPRDIATGQKSWKLRSEVGCSCGNSDKAAKWVWVANGHDSIALYGALALQHPGCTFRIACRVRGHATIQDSNLRLHSILQFGDETSILKWWKIDPKCSNEDVSASVKQLEQDIRDLNTNPVGRNPLDAKGGVVTHSAIEVGQPQSHSYAAPSIGGNANVVLGNVTYMGNPDPRLFPPADQQSNSQISNLPLPQGTAG